MKTAPTKPLFFAKPADFRAWLKAHHQDTPELWVGFYKKDSGRPSITWPESVDEALCVGWIDGIRKSVSEDSYTIRFTPRRRGSVWSSVNIKRCQALADRGRLRRAGLKAFQARRENRSGIYAYEQRRDQLEEAYASKFKKHKTAWTFFQNQPSWYKKQAGWWVISAKKEETRLKRLQKLIEYSAEKKRA